MPDKIAAGLVSRTYFNVPLWAAQEHGFFAKEGLQVEGTIYGNASQVAPLLDGTFQVSIRPACSSNRQMSVNVPPESTPTRQRDMQVTQPLVVPADGPMTPASRRRRLATTCRCRD